jgi:peroxiredoxin
VLAALLAVSLVLATRSSQQATQGNTPLVGKVAPGFTATALEGGGTVTLSQYRGRYVFLNFFASWCGPCQQEAPDLVQFAFEQSRLPGGAAVLSVDFTDTNAGARGFISTYGTTWPSLQDPNGSIAYDYGVESPPTTFLITPKGTVFNDLLGPVTVANLTAMLRAAHAQSGGAHAG